MPALEKQKTSPYDIHPSLAMYQKTLAGMKEKTGRSLEEWIKLVKKEGPQLKKSAVPGSKRNTAWE